MRIWTIFVLLILLILTACAPNNATPTPTIIPLDRSAITPTTPVEPVVDIPPTATRIPPPSPTPTRTPLATPMLAATPAASPTVKAAGPQVEVIAAGLNLRQGPGVNYPVVSTASAGDVFEVIGASASGSWLQVNITNSRPAWISNQPEYTRLIGLLEDVPVIQGPPPAATATASVATPVAVKHESGDGKLVFMTGSGGDLYVINMDGAGLRHLASGVIDPVVSPDGQRVAFTRWDGAKFGTLYVINLDGTGERAVLGEIRQAKSPTWSADGQEVIVSFQHGGLRDPQPECRNFDSDDGFQLPAVSEITSVHVANDGEVRVCFIRLEDLKWGLRQVNIATGQFEDLPADDYSYNPVWDPQNSWRIIYDGQKGLMQLDINTGQLTPFTTDVRDTAPVFSSDGQKLALTYKQHDHWEVYTYDLATGARQRLTKPPILATPQYNSAAPAWSPDGSQIAFVTDRSGQYPEGTGWEIWVMNADGSNQRPLFTPEVQAQFNLEYRGVNERMLNWAP